MKSLSYTRQQVISLGQFSSEDFEYIKQCRGKHTKLGLAYQLTFVRLLNRFPVQQPLEIIDEILVYVSAQLGIVAKLIYEYDHRRETVAEHQDRICNYLDLRPFSTAVVSEVEPFIFSEAFRLEQITALRARTKEFLRSQHILEPADDTIRRLIQTQREAARTFIYNRITELLSNEMKMGLDALLAVEQKRYSSLHHLKQPPARPSPTGLVKLTQKLEHIKKMAILEIGLDWLNNNFQRTLARYAQRFPVFRLRQLKDERRYAVLVCFLHQLYRDTIDEMVDMYDKLINKVYNRAGRDLDFHMKTQRKQLSSSLSHYKTVLGVLLDETITDAAVRRAVFERIEKQALQAEIDEVETYLDGKYSHPFNLVVERHAYLRQFVPALLKHLHLQPEDASSEDLLKATHLLTDMNAAGRRKLPDDAPLEFMPKRLRSLVLRNGKPNKPAWECALMTVVRDEIKSGNLSVGGSKRFGRLDDFFIPQSDWETRREAFFARAALPLKADEVCRYLTKRLNQAYDRFLERLPDNSYAQINEDGWHLSADPVETIDKARVEQFKRWLGGQMRVVKLPELLIDVDNELHFTRNFLPPAERGSPRAEHVCAVLATIMAHGCNIGVYTMSHLIDDVGYHRMKQITDWMLTEEAQRSALAQVVNAISRLDIKQAWGSGHTSSSDGQRFAFRRKVLQQTYSPNFSGFAIEFYSFVADNYAPFYSIPIECTDRDAPYILDGLLYNESDLPLEEHYTDTHGYTENNFAAFAMLGRRFAPMIRGLHKQRIYRIDQQKDYGPLAVLVGRADRTIHLNWITEQWDRIGHFYASLEYGHTTASTAMKRLNGFTGKNHFYRANRELGRIFKTEHILEYMSDKTLRQRTRRGLLKGEQIHALARDLNYGKRGRISKRDWVEQRNSSSCLTLIIACIIYWQAKEINRAIQTGEPVPDSVDLSSIEHISPITWDNVILYGEYVLDRNLVKV